MSMAAVEVRPRFRNSSKENVELVRNQIADAGHTAEAIEFAHLVKVLRQSMETGGVLDEHPLTIAARQVGATVHWVH